MFRDCLRCGAGWHDCSGSDTDCICKGMTDAQAAYVKHLHDHHIALRRIGRKAVDGKPLTTEELASIGIYI